MGTTINLEQVGDKFYRVVDGTYYNEKTPDDVIRLLERLRKNGTSVIVRYGDTETGFDWMEENDVEGTVGRSTGTVKIPLLVPRNENGGPGMLDHCIVKIVDAITGKALYTHPHYWRRTVKIHPSDTAPYVAMALFDDEIVARFKTAQELAKFVRIMYA